MDINTDDPNDDPTKEEQDAHDLAELLQELSSSFDKLCQERHEAGQQEYGVFTFMGNDVIRMMMEELADTSNYCRMQFMKLMFLQMQLEQDPRIAALEDRSVNLGKEAFKGAGEIGWT